MLSLNRTISIIKKHTELNTAGKKILPLFLKQYQRAPLDLSNGEVMEPPLQKPFSLKKCLLSQTGTSALFYEM